MCSHLYLPIRGYYITTTKKDILRYFDRLPSTLNAEKSNISRGDNLQSLIWMSNFWHTAKIHGMRAIFMPNVTK